MRVLTNPRHSAYNVGKVIESPRGWGIVIGQV
jgi:hypothetical protein